MSGNNRDSDVCVESGPMTQYDVVKHLYKLSVFEFNSL